MMDMASWFLVVATLFGAHAIIDGRDTGRDPVRRARGLRVAAAVTSRSLRRDRRNYLTELVPITG